MSHRFFATFLIAAMSFWTSACWDSPEDAGKIKGGGGVARAPLERPSPEHDYAEESTEVTSAQRAPHALESESNSAEIIRRLDSALASGDEETVLDLMLDLEDRGGAESVTGLGIVVDRALDDDLKLDAIASLAVLSDEDDVSAPLLRAIDDRSPAVRIEALDVMAYAEMVNLLPVLRVRIRRESDPETREALEETIEELEFFKERSGR